MLLDTSGLLTLLSVREADHTQAKNLFAQSPSNLTHNYVLAELVALATVQECPGSFCSISSTVCWKCPKLN